MTNRIGGAGLIRITTVTAYAVAFLLSVVPTGGYLAMSRSELRFALEHDALAGAGLVAREIQKSQNPAGLSAIEFAQLVEQIPVSGAKEVRRILDASGTLLAESKDSIGMWPMTARSPIVGANGPLGTLEVSRSLTEIFGDAVGVAIVSLWLATWSFLFLRILPNRALENALKEAVESRMAADEAVLARDKAKEAARLRSVFLANMGHELRTPLNGVIGMIDLLSDTELDPEQRSYAELAGTSGRNLLNIVNDILDFSKLDDGAIEIVPVSFVLNEVMQQIMQAFSTAALKKQIQLECHIDPDVPELVVADPVRIRQVLVCLIGNGLKFTKTGKVTVTVRRLKQEPQQFLEFVVEDTGVGIAPDQLENIFQPFTQADDSMTRLHGGTGLGLAIARKLAKSMDGDLRASSEIGHGSTFYFQMPLSAKSSGLT